MVIDANICFECGATERIHQHHIIPKSLGGTKTIPLCEICHGRVHQKDLVKFNNLAKEGIRRYVANGGKLGRKVGTTESIEKFMSKSTNIEIKRLVEKGHSVRKIAKILEVSTSTVVKVRRHTVIPKQIVDPVQHTFF